MLACAARGGFAHVLDERYGVGERDLPRPRAVSVAPDRPRAFVVMRVRGQAFGEVDAAAIEQLAAGRHRDEQRRVSVLGDTDGR